MPVRTVSTGKGKGFCQYGTHGAKYHFGPGADNTQAEAREKAGDQGFAIRKSQDGEGKSD
jgi:hypothetical protein